MVERGVSQRGCAEYFGCSPAAICKTLKRIRSLTLPESVERLTDKQRAFVLAKAGGMTNADAVMQAYNVTTKESAKALGTQLMQDPDIKVAMVDLMAQEGIPKRYRIKRLKDIIDAKDPAVAARGLDMSFKLGNDYAPEKVDVTIDHRILSARIEEIHARLRGNETN